MISLHDEANTPAPASDVRAPPRKACVVDCVVAAAAAVAAGACIANIVKPAQVIHKLALEQGWPEPYINTVYDRI